MWQTEISFDGNKKREKEFVLNELSKINKVDFVTTFAKNRYYITIVAQNEDKKIAQKLVQDIVSKLVLVFYKLDFLCDILDIEVEDLTVCAFLSCLLYFDIGYENSLLKKKLAMQDSYNLEGIINFSIAKLKKNWRELSELTEGLFAVGCTDEEIFSLMNYILSNTTSEKNTVFISNVDNQVVITNTTKGTYVDIVDVYKSYEANIINAIMSQMPKEIICDKNKDFKKCTNVLQKFIKVKFID